jgi:3-methyl-2-oxobutanoate hydroxymethyltransferase
VLVFHDLLGIHEGLAPRFAKRYAQLKGEMVAAVGRYAREVRSGAFPGPEHVYSIDTEELERFRAGL